MSLGLVTFKVVGTVLEIAEDELGRWWIHDEHGNRLDGVRHARSKGEALSSAFAIDRQRELDRSAA